ncbi:MAG: hypothetical protein ABIW17_11385 [Marmoricola sp.]
MNLRHIFKPVAAAILAVGLLSFGVAPADAAPLHKATTMHTCDTGWG